jgi:tagatose-1,6-bisphosphate aldolase non-catalytic subunit AgaZ/GatZ
VLDQAVRRDAASWRGTGVPVGRTQGRLFSFNDRSRHHWTDPEVAAEVERLLDATAGNLPRQLLGHHLPLALDAVLDGTLVPEGAAIVRHGIRRVLEGYRAACGPR